MSEFAGTLRERIVIERPINVRNDMGLQEPGWEEVCRCLASIALESVGQESEGQALSAMARFRIAIRWRDGIALDRDTRSFSTHLARRLELRAAKLRAEAEKKANQERELAARLHLLAARLRKEEETHTEAAPPH